MRFLKHAAAAIALLALGGCAATAGTAAGDFIGGTAWVMGKGGSLAWKGGSFAVKTTGRTMIGAARGVHEEFSGPKAEPVQSAEARPAPADGADLANRVKDPGESGVLSERERASLAD